MVAQNTMRTCGVQRVIWKRFYKLVCHSVNHSVTDVTFVLVWHKLNSISLHRTFYIPKKMFYSSLHLCFIPKASYFFTVF